MGVYLFYRSFELENHVPVFPSGPTDSITKVLTDVHENFRPKTRQNSESPKLHGLYYTKIEKMEVYLLWGSYELENESVCPLGQTSSITKVINGCR